MHGDEESWLSPCLLRNENGGSREMPAVWQLPRLQLEKNHVCVSVLETQAQGHLRGADG